MDFDDMTSDKIRDLIASAERTLATRGAIDRAARAVTDAISAYASAAGVEVLEAWKILAPEGVDVPEPGPTPTAPAWVQPTGAHDAYKTGDHVSFQGVVYESTRDGNVWSPVAYPMGWRQV